ncbi:hypothetical protein AVEN_86825-1 [Araneus ventricosus]|uniref:Uncharacterized protein n=1 Tax=Araneus ventricosus TaxID=182803 RepID=A0A4Y2D1T7_ARAVE|nr:hypothetical protein AVEN_86825-1 [Araneus ventricosus]
MLRDEGERRTFGMLWKKKKMRKRSVSVCVEGASCRVKVSGTDEPNYKQTAAPDTLPRPSHTSRRLASGSRALRANAGPPIGSGPASVGESDRDSACAHPTEGVFPNGPREKKKRFSKVEGFRKERDFEEARGPSVEGLESECSEQSF